MEDICYWLDTLKDGLKCIAFVEKIYVRKHMKMEKICPETLCKYTIKLIEMVEEKIKLLLPQKFALLFN